MSNRVVYSKTLTAAAATAVAASQSGTANVPLNINGSQASSGVATIGAAASSENAGGARRVIITSAGNDSGITFTLTGTNSTGNPIRDVVTGANVGAAVSNYDFVTVTSIIPSANTTAAVTAGTNTTGSTTWIRCNYQITPFEIGMAVVVAGTINYTVEYTYDAIESAGALQSPSSVPTAWPHPQFTAKTANADGTLDNPLNAVRLTINSGTGTATLTFIQAGIAN